MKSLRMNYGKQPFKRQGRVRKSKKTLNVQQNGGTYLPPIPDLFQSGQSYIVSSSMHLFSVLQYRPGVQLLQPPQPSQVAG